MIVARATNGARAFAQSLAFFAAAFPGAIATPEGAPPFTGPIVVGQMQATPRQEASGLAPSRRAPGRLWTHNDSGDRSVLYALDASGEAHGTLVVRGVANQDWEDLASFAVDGKAWLLVADTGDNGGGRPNVQLHVLEEPAPEKLKPGSEVAVSPAYSLRVRYPDGPRDCESVAVDPAERMIYLLTKRDLPPRLYRVPLRPAAGIVVAEFCGTVPRLALLERTDNTLVDLVGRFTSFVTALSFSPDGTTALVLTYGDPVLFARKAGESWAEAMTREPVRLAGHGLPQAEGACFSADGRSLFVVSERQPALVRYDRRR